MADRVQGYGGVIVLSNSGEVALSFTTERMSWAWAKGDELHSGINPGEDFVEPVVIETSNGFHSNGINGGIEVNGFNGHGNNGE